MGASLLLEHGTAFSVESVVDIQIFSCYLQHPQIKLGVAHH